MKKGISKLWLVSVLLMLINAVMVAAAPLPSAPVIDNVQNLGDGNVNVTWKAGMYYNKYFLSI